MSDRNTDRSRRVMALAREHARRLQHGYIGTEHVLLALLDLPDGGAIGTFDRLGVDRVAVRGDLASRLAPGSAAVDPGQLPFTPRLKNALEHAVAEAAGLRQHWLGSEHLLLGLLRVRGGRAAGLPRRPTRLLCRPMSSIW